ncbi:putative nucleotidyltransferase [Collimonas arenae]|uniref:Putative nucleotidyltransferase n=1 Tax=Collimonas arenae TaxID=279058 RepID=A0A0A1FAY2_9BURK|nr:hypothetical protein [Collimonas arenae]AIY40022.1 putative nucleotidyltransferase [Collimonas arenae]
MPVMASNLSPELEQLRAEIAAAAARMIAEDGADYGTAKRKALELCVGSTRARSGSFMPDNAQIEDEVRIYNELFFADTQPARLLHLRQLAVEIMGELAQFRPYLTGAVLNGTAGEHSDIYLHLFVDSPKDVEIFLFNKNVQFELSSSPSLKSGGNNDPVETVSFMYKREGLHLTLYETDDLRGNIRAASGKRMERADLNTVLALINKEED